MFDGYLDLVDAAREIGIHPQSLRRLVKQGQVPNQMVFGKYMFEEAALRQFKAAYDPRPGRKALRRLI